MSKETRALDELAVQRVRMAAEAVANNINEFGTITDGELVVSLDAAMSALSRSKPVAGVDVKPLEWEDFWKQDEGYRQVARVAFGATYHVSAEGWWFPLSELHHCKSIDEAKAAAEDDYRQRILSALVLPTHKPLQEEG